jgi:hypothetical protein
MKTKSLPFLFPLVTILTSVYFQNFRRVDVGHCGGLIPNISTRSANDNLTNSEGTLIYTSRNEIALTSTFFQQGVLGEHRNIPASEKSYVNMSSLSDAVHRQI